MYYGICFVVQNLVFDLKKIEFMSFSHNHEGMKWISREEHSLIIYVEDREERKKIVGKVERSPRLKNLKETSERFKLK